MKRVLVISWPMASPFCQINNMNGPGVKSTLGRVEQAIQDASGSLGLTLFYLRGGKQIEQAEQLFLPRTVFLAQSDELTKQWELHSPYGKKSHEPRE